MIFVLVDSSSICNVFPEFALLARVQRGREKVTKAGLDGSVQLVIGDAEDLKTGVPDGKTFDGATMAFVIRNGAYVSVVAPTWYGKQQFLSAYTQAIMLLRNHQVRVHVFHGRLFHMRTSKENHQI